MPQISTKPRVGRRTQEERRAGSEQALLKAAIEVISTDGVGAVTFEALARAGGFSRGLASQRFGSKAKLIESVLRELHERQDRLVEERRFDAQRGLAAILAYFERLLRDIAHDANARAYFMLLSVAIADASKSRAAFAEVHASVKRRLSGWVAKGQAEGDIRRGLDPDSTAEAIGCLMVGVNMQLLVDPAIDLEALRASSLAMLKASLTASV